MTAATFPMRGDKHDAAWAAAQRLRSFSYHELAAETDLPLDRVQAYVRAWCSAGLVEKTGRGAKYRLHFRVTGRAPLPARRGTPESNMWQAMRSLKSFTPTDVAAHATTDEVLVEPDQARGYCRMLLGAGYLRVVQTARHGRREATYRLIRDTGPKPPRQCRIRAVFDDNLGELVHHAGVGQ